MSTSENNLFDTDDTTLRASSTERRRKTMPHSVHFSSATDLWATPDDVFHELHREFQFTLDVCALAENAKCRSFYSPAEDGLLQPWTGTCWMNPPYGREIGRWVAKARGSAEGGATVVCLIPARTDTAWWHEHVIHADEVRFIRGRLRFGNARNAAPFPSAIVVFRAKLKRDTRWARGVFYRRIAGAGGGR